MKFKFKGPADNLILAFFPKKFQIFIKVEEPNNVTYIIQYTKPIKL